MRLNPSLEEVPIFCGDPFSLFALVFFVGNGFGVVVNALRPELTLMMVAIAGLFSSFLCWLFSRVRFASLQRNDSAKRGALVVPIATLLAASLYCLFVSVFAT